MRGSRRRRRAYDGGELLLEDEEFFAEKLVLGLNIAHLLAQAGLEQFAARFVVGDSSVQLVERGRALLVFVEDELELFDLSLQRVHLTPRFFVVVA